MTPTPTPPPDISPARTAAPPMSVLIDRSSLGARDARQARARVAIEVAQRIVDRAGRDRAAD